MLRIVLSLFHTRFTVGLTARTSPILTFLTVMRGLGGPTWGQQSCCSSPVSLSGGENIPLFPVSLLRGLGLF